MNHIPPSFLTQWPLDTKMSLLSCLEGKYFQFELHLFVTELMSWRLAGRQAIEEDIPPPGLLILVFTALDIFDRRLVSKGMTTWESKQGKSEHL